jgi:transposase
MSTDATTPATTSPPAPPQQATALDPSKLPDDPALLKQMIIELITARRQDRRELADVQQRLDALLQRLYGRRADAFDPNQPLLFPELAEALPAAPPPPIETEESRPSRRGKSQHHGRRRPAANLRHEQRRYELTAAERVCPDCGQERQEIGVESTGQFEYKPAEVYVIDHQRVKYACKCCQGCVTIAPKPPQPLDKGLPGPGLLAHVITDKYLDHIPLHRTEQRLARLGAPVARSTMCDWMAACAVLLSPLCQLLKAWVLASKVLHTDDTTVAVRDERKTEHRYGRLWDYIGDEAHPGIVFTCRPANYIPVADLGPWRW